MASQGQTGEHANMQSSNSNSNSNSNNGHYHIPADAHIFQSPLTESQAEGVDAPWFEAELQRQKEEEEKMEEMKKLYDAEHPPTFDMSSSTGTSDNPQAQDFYTSTGTTHEQLTRRTVPPQLHAQRSYKQSPSTSPSSAHHHTSSSSHPFIPYRRRYLPTASHQSGGPYHSSRPFHTLPHSYSLRNGRQGPDLLPHHTEHHVGLGVEIHSHLHNTPPTSPYSSLSSHSQDDSTWREHPEDMRFSHAPPPSSSFDLSPNSPSDPLDPSLSAPYDSPPPFTSSAASSTIYFHYFNFTAFGVPLVCLAFFLYY